MSFNKLGDHVYHDVIIDIARIMNITFHAPEHNYKFSFWVETNISMSCCAISRCNTNSGHHIGITNYLPGSYECNFVEKQILHQTSTMILALSPEFRKR